MKYLMMVLSVSLIGFTSFADHHEGGQGKGKMKFEERKAKVLSNIDQRMAGLQEFKTCVSGATEKAKLKECRKAHMEKRKSFRAERRNM